MDEIPPMGSGRAAGVSADGDHRGLAIATGQKPTLGGERRFRYARSRRRAQSGACQVILVAGGKGRETLIDVIENR
jgi:hypothetical protein